MANMGLVQAARQIESYGRGPDTTLAHISPDEAEFVDYLQGGRRENPHTGLPEYSMFGKILKAVARVAGGIGGFMIGGPAGAALGSGIATKLTGGSWKDALKGAAMSGIGGELGQGLSGAGWSVTGAGSAAASGAAAGTGTLTGTQGLNASLAASGGSGSLGATPGFYSSLANAGSAAGGTAGASGLSALSTAAPGALASAAPTGLGAALAPIGGYGSLAAGLGSLSTPLSPETSMNGPAPAPGPQINLNVAPFDRKYQPYTGDATKFGQQPGGWQFFDEVNPQPKYLARGGQVRGYALGGGVMNMQQPGGGLMGLGGLRNPGIPSQIQIPSTPMPGQQSAGAMNPRDNSPAAQRQRILAAARIGYMSAADGGPIYGPGDGKSDDIPANLSNNEHVIDSSTISDLGNGDPDSGHARMEQIKTEIRRRAGRRNPHKPTPKQSGSARGLVGMVMK